MKKQLGALVAAIALALAASSCSADSGPTATSTPTVVDTGPAELSAAIDAYTPFNAAFDLFLSGEDPDVAFSGLVTPRFLQSIADDLEHHPRSTLTRGSSSFSDAKLVGTGSTEADDDLAMAVCRDVSRTTIVDATTGEDATPTERRLRIPLVVSFSRTATGLLVEEVSQWDEESYCL